MNTRILRSVSAITVIVLGALTLPGCGGGETPSAAKPAAKASTANVLGKYENAQEKLLIELKADNKAYLTDEEGKTTELPWEMDGADKVVVHGTEGINLVYTINSEGHLSDGMGGVYRKK